MKFLPGIRWHFKDIKAGEDIIKYGNRIGIAKEDIKAGDWIHTHNIKTALGDLLEYKYIQRLRDRRNRT